MNAKEQAKLEVIAAVGKLSVQYEKDIKAAARDIIDRLQEQSTRIGSYDVVSIDIIKLIIADKLDTQFNIEL